MTGQASHDSSRGRPHALERRISLLLLGVLLLAAAGVVVAQFYYDPTAWRGVTGVGQTGSAGGKAADGEARAQEPAVQGLTPLSSPETYDAETLSDKIDGKAELYLSAGFRELVTRRFGLDAVKGAWMERYVYDMGNYANAFAVFSAQRRPGARTLSLTGDAYLAANGLFFVNGRHYVEIIASRESREVQTRMEDLARSFVAAHPASGTAVSPMRFLPDRDRVADSAARVAQNAFGLDGFDDIYTAAYHRNGMDAIAFVARRSTARAALTSADAFVDYFTEFGGRLLEPPAGRTGLRVVEVLGAYEVIQTRGAYLFGVHEAGDLQQAMDLADTIGRAIQATGGEDAAAK
ncbi:MAG: hypothetical protein P8X55_03435 [Desulfosarcinaceae bacterium]